LVHAVGPLLRPAGRAAQGDCAADAVRSLLGERVAGLVSGTGPADDDLPRLHRTDEEARSPAFGAGVLKDRRTVLELAAVRNCRLRTID
jgi:hypothetical protein